MKKIYFPILLTLIILVYSQSIHAQDFTANSFIQEGLNTFATADFNNDGLPDLVGLNNTSLGNRDLQILMNKSNSSIEFESVIILSEDLMNGSPAVGDLDGDGDIDVVVSFDISKEILILRNNGDNTFDPVSTNFNGVNELSLYDLENDGDLDLIGYIFDDNIVTTFINDGNGNLTEGTTTEHDNDISSVDYGDIDDDGDIDFALSIDKFSGETVAIYLNDSMNNFSKLSSFDINALNSALQIKLVDLNQDGKMDLLGMNDKKLTAFYQNSVFGFIDQDIINPSNEGDLSVFDVADFDNDGDLDIVVGDLSADLHWYKNESIGFIQMKISEMMPMKSLHAEDFDGDGDIDFVASNGDFRAYRNDFLSSVVPLIPEGDIEMFPNPAEDYFELSAKNNGVYDVSLFNAQGKFLKSKSFTNSIRISLDELPSGLYTIQVYDTDKQAFLFQKLTKI